ncbi:DUF2786 domain-containing protein [Acetobacter oryzifermentans]|uniref:DUF2786 domain-containing protein n=1 Tax=Acetobacter oryzifermentans TaxID=1633874 RepID=UPI0039BF6E06
MTEDQRNKLIERIKRLLALSKSPNEHEAAAAMSKAQELMRELSITEEDLELTDFATVRTDTLLVKSGHKLPVYVSDLACLMETAFGVECIFSDGQRNKDVIFVGTKSKTEICVYTWTVLARILKTKMAEYKFSITHLKCSPGKKAALAEEYCEGWVSGVRQNIVPDTVSQRESELTKKLINMKFKIKPADLRGSGASGDEANDAYFQGIQARENTRLHQGMQADKRGTLSETRYLGRA